MPRVFLFEFFHFFSIYIEFFLTIPFKNLLNIGFIIFYISSHLLRPTESSLISKTFLGQELAIGFLCSKARSTLSSIFIYGLGWNVAKETGHHFEWIQPMLLEHKFSIKPSKIALYTKTTVNVDQDDARKPRIIAKNTKVLK